MSVHSMVQWKIKWIVVEKCGKNTKTHGEKFLSLWICHVWMKYVGHVQASHFSWLKHAFRVTEWKHLNAYHFKAAYQKFISHPANSKCQALGYFKFNPTIRCHTSQALMLQAHFTWPSVCTRYSSHTYISPFAHNIRTII